MIHQKVKFKNSTETVLWNMRKNYLLELEGKNLSVARLKIVPQGSELNLAELVRGFEPSSRVVVKPSISGGARNTKRLEVRQLFEESEFLKLILKDSDLIIQPYFEEIANEGEYSFLFFRIEFSHVVLKKPASGDFRVQPYHGASTHPYTLSPSEISEAAKYINSVNPRPSYGRVDGFKKDGKFQLMELELIERFVQAMLD